jgi:hypothetical protein
MKFSLSLTLAAAAALSAIVATPLQAASIAISIGIRETQAGGGTSGGPIFSNGAAAGGIEFVNRDGQMLEADGTWQLFTFTPSTDTLTAFAGATANSVLDGEWGTLEMIRALNVDGITQPIRLWVDNITNTTTSGATVEGFETYAAGAEVMFQEPRFSGSTANQLAMTPNASAVTSSMAYQGANSYQMDYQYVSGATTNWVRLTTFNTTNLPNPAIRIAEPGAPAPTISFYAKAVVVPEPSAAALALCAAIGLWLMKRHG